YLVRSGNRASLLLLAFFFQAQDGIRVFHVTGVQTCALPISHERLARRRRPDPVPRGIPGDSALVALRDDGSPEHDDAARDTELVGVPAPCAVARLEGPHGARAALHRDEPVADGGPLGRGELGIPAF